MMEQAAVRNRNEGTTPSIQDDPATSADYESSLNMPQTNATKGILHGR